MTPAPARCPSSRRTAKVLVTGPAGAGRSTFISTLTGPVAQASGDGDVPGASGPQTPPAVATDFGQLEVDGDLTLLLHGTPAHDRYGFMVDILAEGMVGYILLVDASRPETLVDTRRARRRFEQAYRVPSVVVVTKLSGDAERFERRLRDELELTPEVPVLLADTSDRADVQRAVVTLLTAAREQALTRSATMQRHSRLGDVG